MNLVLIDLSSIAHPIYAMTANDPNPNRASIDIVARIRALASGQPNTAICCDKGRSFRHDLTATYKANRPEHEAMLHHQIKLAVETLAGDGFPIWAAPGFEADDVIASAAAKAAEMPDTTVLVVSSDKDLTALVSPLVSVKSLHGEGKVYDEDAVEAKFGVMPAQMRDWLALVGDTSDNVKGAAGIGPKKAAELLTNYGTIESIYANLANATNGEFTPSVRKSLENFRPQLDLTRQLITLRTDAEIPFEQILEPRQVRDVSPMEDDMPDQIDDAMPMVTQEPPAVPRNGDKTAAEPEAISAPIASPTAGVAFGGTYTPPPSTALAVQSDVLAPAPAEWERQLEPRSMREVVTLAKYIFESRLFSAYGTPQGVLATMLAGRELGMSAMASLRAFHIIDGKPTLAADLIRALVVKSGKVKYFRCTERTPTRATFEAQRNGDPPISLTYSVEEGRAAFSGDDKKWAASGWGKNPADMCVARAGAKLARLIAPDVIHSLYASEEFDR